MYWWLSLGRKNGVTWRRHTHRLIMDMWIADWANKNKKKAVLFAIDAYIGRSGVNCCSLFVTTQQHLSKMSDQHGLGVWWFCCMLEGWKHQFTMKITPTNTKQPRPLSDIWEVSRLLQSRDLYDTRVLPKRINDTDTENCRTMSNYCALLKRSPSVFCLLWWRHMSHKPPKMATKSRMNQLYLLIVL